MSKTRQLPGTKRIFKFQWDLPASEVYVTGTFDNWAKNNKLQKNGEVFTATVVLNEEDTTQNIHYKFVVDGNWVTKYNDPQEIDSSGNLNNVITLDRIAKLPTFSEFTGTTLMDDHSESEIELISIDKPASESDGDMVPMLSFDSRGPGWREDHQKDDQRASRASVWPDPVSPIVDSSLYSYDHYGSVLEETLYPISETGAVYGDDEDLPGEPLSRTSSWDSIVSAEDLHRGFLNAESDTAYGSGIPTNNSYHFRQNNITKDDPTLGPTKLLADSARSEMKILTSEGNKSSGQAEGLDRPIRTLKGTLGPDSEHLPWRVKVDRSNDEADDDEDDESADESYDSFELPKAQIISIVPNYEGFKAHVRRLNPDMLTLYGWLVSRIANQQEIRYQNLLDLRVRHDQAVRDNTCFSGDQCIATGGTAYLLNSSGHVFFTDSGSENGGLTAASFPVGVPLPPSGFLPAQYECRLCFKLKRFQKPSDWTKHVHEDVQPFTCTFENCKESKSFKRKADWVRHENERHRHLEWWDCEVDDCRHRCYRKDNMIQHLVREHRLSVPKPPAKAAIKRARQTETVWTFLEKYHHETQNKPQDEPCMFCNRKFYTWKKLTVHLAKHMEDIALPILRLVGSVDAETLIPTLESASKPIPLGDELSRPSLTTSTQLNPSGTDAALHSEPASPQANDLDWDLKSIASLNTFRDSALGSSIPSNISISDAQELPRTAQEEVLIILNSDAKLRSLFEEAARRIDKTRFVRNIRRLFLLFHKDLQESAVDPREKDANGIIEKHAQWLASRLFDVCDPNNNSNNRVMAAHLDQQLDKRPLLENYLAALTTQSKRTQKAHTQTQLGAEDILVTKVRLDLEVEAMTNIEDDNSFEEEESERSMDGEIIIDYSKFPNLDHIRKFILGGVAFENLRRNTSQFIHPELNLSLSNKNPQTQEGMQSSEYISGSALISHNQLVSDSVTQESRSSTGTTDITMPDVDSESDDDSSELSSDPELYDGVLEDRILNPKAYFEKLRAAERDTFGNSGVSAHYSGYRIGLASGPADDDFFLRNRGISPHLAFRDDVDREQIISLIKFTKSEKLLQLLESYNLLVRMNGSLTKLRQIGYCTLHIPILVKDQNRPHVAKLVQVDIKIIDVLGAAFGGLISSVVSAVFGMQIGSANQGAVNSLIENLDVQSGVTTACLQALMSMGFLPHLLSNDLRPVIWECAVQSLELAILSYAGAHVQRFDLELLEREVYSFEIPRRFIYHDPTLKAISSWTAHESISFRRRQLQCLDKFLGEIQPWVFHQDFSNRGDERLCLSTKIEALTDLWGPAWKVVRDSDAECIQQYDIGSGAIVPWPTNNNLWEQSIEVHSNEVFCHWISFKEWNIEEIQANQCSLPRKHFLDSDTLLIGATNDFGLIVNPGCTTSIEKLFSIKSKLDQQGALRAPNTFRSHRYVDSHAVQVQGSALGFFTAGDTVTYKRRNGQTMKDALVERWRHNLRNPMDLEAFSGVEISLCTRNARRRRLLHLLGSQTMYNYLRGITFVWTSEACEYAYFKALRSPKSFRKFWKCHPEYHANIGDAISKCLDALEETGIDEDSRELRGLWVESFDTIGDSDGESDDESDHDQKLNPPSSTTTINKPFANFFEEWIVTLFRSEHTWTGFLEDSEESLTMAVLGMSCLDFDHNGYGRRCSKPLAPITSQVTDTKGYPVLQTSLQINASLLSSTKLKQETVSSGQTTIWNAKELKKGTSFSLGDHGSLKVLTAASRTCPVIMEWSGVKSEIAKEIKNVAVNEKLLGRNKERHHREYIRGKWEAKPLPVLVLSEKNKILFAKN